MNKISHPIAPDEARAALESLAEASKITVNSMRPPLWLILLCSVSLGIKTVAMGVMINDSLWNSIQWVSYIVCCLGVVAWILALRAKGITVKIIDVKITTMAIIFALLICVLLVSSRAIYLQTDTILFPCVAGFLNASLLAFGLYFGLRRNAKNMEKDND